MQELVLVLGSVAGACTAVAIDRIPKRKNNKLIFRANPVIKNHIQSLKIEKEILTKTISRLYQQDSDLTKIQRDKLLLRYQHQLGLIIAKIEKLEDASRHPDLGPLGDGLITLMDQKLSQLDQKLHEISSKITISPSIPQIKQSDPIKEVFHEKPIIKIEPKTEVQKANHSNTPIEVLAESHRSVELITLTEIPNKMPEFPIGLVRPNIAVQKQVELGGNTSTHPESKSKIQPVIEIPKSGPLSSPVDNKIQIPVAVKIPEDEKLDDDDKDIDKIKSEIMKALSKLEQVEVE